MTLNTALVGKEYDEVPFEVERERIVQFADAIGDPDPRYRSEQPIAPPTFPTVMQIATGGQVVLDPELGLDYSRVVVTDRVGELHDAVPLHVELHLAVLLADELAVQRHGYVPSCAPVTGMIAPLT